MTKLTKAAKNLKAGERLCKRCSGSGHWIEKDQICFRCQGTGVEADLTSRFQAVEWLNAWLKEGIGCDRNEVIEQYAAVVDQCNREGPYNAIAAAPRIRALKMQTQDK